MVHHISLHRIDIFFIVFLFKCYFHIYLDYFPSSSNWLSHTSTMGIKLLVVSQLHTTGLENFDQSTSGFELGDL
jgi:hypothetical protein